MSRFRRYFVPLLLLAGALFVGGKLLLTSVKREYDSRDNLWYYGDQLPKPYKTALLAMQDENQGLHDRGWPWSFVMSLIANNTKTGQNEWIVAEFHGWALAADVAILLLAMSILAFWAARHYRRRGRWLAFSLRELLVVTLLCAAACGWWFNQYQQWKREQPLLDLFSVTKAYCGPAWLRRFVAIDKLQLFARAVDISGPVRSPTTTSLEDRQKVVVQALAVMPYVCRLGVIEVPIQLIDCSTFSQIEWLYIGGQGFDDDMLQELWRWPQLRKLGIGGINADPNISDRGLELIGKCRNLQWFNLNHAIKNVSAEGVAHLRHLTELRELDLLNTYVTDEGVMAFAGMKQLKTLELTATSITDAATEALSRLSTLEELRLAHCEGISDEGVARLTKLPRLRFLDLAYTNVTDATVESLTKMPALRKVDLSECRKITDLGVRRLVARLDVLKVYFLNLPPLSSETNRLLKKRNKEGFFISDAEIAHL